MDAELLSAPCCLLRAAFCSLRNELSRSRGVSLKSTENDESRATHVSIRRRTGRSADSRGDVTCSSATSADAAAAAAFCSSRRCIFATSKRTTGRQSTYRSLEHVALRQDHSYRHQVHNNNCPETIRMGDSLLIGMNGDLLEIYRRGNASKTAASSDAAFECDLKLHMNNGVGLVNLALTGEETFM